MISQRLRVALLEDDPSRTELLGHWLTTAGHLCSRHVHRGTLVRALARERFDVLVLDSIVPDMSDVDVLRHVRGTLGAPVPILLVSDRDREGDIVIALRGGADDYMVRPVRPLELLARLEAISRRMAKRPDPQVIDLKTLRLDCQSRIAWRDGVPVQLSAKDFDLSVLFLLNLGRPLSRAELRETVWGCGAVAGSRTLDAHVSRIRDKLGLTPRNGWRLTAVYGRGYRLQEVATRARRVYGEAAITESS